MHGASIENAKRIVSFIKLIFVIINSTLAHYFVNYCYVKQDENIANLVSVQLKNKIVKSLFSLIEMLQIFYVSLL